MKRFSALMLVGLVAGALIRVEAQAVPALDAIKNNICGKVRRELVKGSLEVYPLKGYGAVEIGTHRFYHPGTQDHDVVGEAKFVQLWQYKDGAWKVSRVISYDHETVK